MSDSRTIRFILDGEPVDIANVDPTRTVLQYLREDRRLKGSKEGCAEGDCGACTVVVRQLDSDGKVQSRAINSCIQFLPTLDGRELVTVEALADGDKLHPVQEAMVRNHGSQCGFCTPGFVMSLYALYENNPQPGRRDIDDALSGNLCRCTGYRPIVAAASQMHVANSGKLVDRAPELQNLQRSETLELERDGRRFLAPRDSDEFASCLARFPDATILAGGTDVGLWVTKQHRELTTVIYSGNVAELQVARVGKQHIEIGAAVALTDAIPLIVQHYPGLDEMFRRFASPPIRNAGTLGGNIANGSPIGDSMAALLVLDAVLLLRCGDTERELPIGDFYHDYMVNDLQPGEFLQGVRIPLPQGDELVRSHKWSKRFDQDISAVCTAYRLRLEGNKVASFRMACGGMAATVKRAPETERALRGQPWTEASVARACEKIGTDFSPIGDMRASADIRLRATQNLLRRFYAESQDDSLQTVYNYGR